MIKNNATLKELVTLISNLDKKLNNKKIKKDYVINNKKAGELLRHARCRAKKKGLEISITLKDILLPKYCPLTGLLLGYTNNKLKQNSPSLDRLDNSKGYTPDNIWVVSHKANSIKNTATMEELKLVRDWMKKIKNQL